MDLIPLRPMDTYNVIVIGGGPAGLIAAGRAAELGSKVLILEKMPSVGRKLLITGSGRCNVTNSASIAEFIKHVYPNGRFIKNSLSKFGSTDILALLKDYRVECTLAPLGRYFPSSNKAKDVLRALLEWLETLNVDIRFDSRVEELLLRDDKIYGVKANGKEIHAKQVVLATGGKSYPLTGSTGDGYKLTERVGHRIENVRPALVPLVTEGHLAQSIQGLNLKNVKATVWINDKKRGEAMGEMIFTHFGLSCPIILTLSRIAVEGLEKKQKVEISLDLEPLMDEQKLDKRLIQDLNEHGKKKVANIFRFWLKASMASTFIKILAIDPEKLCHQISSKERKQIRHLIQNLSFKVVNHRGFKEAIITAGGVSTNEISSKTMESKLIKGLHFAGEIIDLDAETGGYNLQLAYSTRWLAGDSCVRNTN